jgi:hypothetical protein
VSSYPDEIWMLDLTDGSYQYLRDGRGGAISPDGNWIAFGDENDQLTVDSMGGGTPQAFGMGGFPSWTPDSEYFVYTGFSAEEQFDLFIASRDGSFNRQLTDDPDWDWYPQVSPDGSQVAFNKGNDEYPPWNIWVLDLTSIVPMDRPEPKNPKVFSTPGTQPKQDLETETSFRLAGPNPTNPSSSFEFTLEEPGNVRLEIYDVRGRLVRRVISENKTEGRHFLTWNGHDENGQHVSSGVYFYVFESGAYRTTGKITVVR